MEVKRESIFASGMRAFMRAFCGAVGLVVGVAVMVILLFAMVGGKVTPGTELVVAADNEGNRQLLPQTAPVILRINVHGVIGMDKLTGKNLELQLMDSQGVMIKKDRVKGILLHINTPGGVVTDADQMYRALQDYKERFGVPVYAYVDGMCASGGVYICAATDKIYASPVSVIGSVGVRLGPNFNVYDLMQKHGVKELTLTQGKDKNVLSPFTQWQEGDEKTLQDIIDYEYMRFVDLITTARPNLNKDKLINEYGAHVFDAPKAQELGYIDDSNGSYSGTLVALTEAVGIEGKYQVIELVPHRMFIADLIEGKVLGLDKIKAALDPNLSKRLFYIHG